MSKNLFTKFFVLLLVVGLLFAVAPTKQAQAANLCVNTDGSGGCYTSIQDAITAAVAGDTITVAAGIYHVPTTITLDKAISIIGPTTGEAKVIGTGTDMFKVFAITSSNVTIKDLEITLAVTPANQLLISDELNSSLISISGGAGMTGIIIQGNEIYVPVQTPPMTGWTARALTVGSNTVSGMVISGNTVYNTRNGIVIQGNNSATITTNTIYNTKGGIMNYTGTAEDAAARVMTNNSWGTVHNEWDIVWNSGGGPYVMDMDKYVLQLSIAQSDARVVSLMTTGVFAELTGNRSHVYVNAVTGIETLHPANGNVNLPYKKIKDAIDAVVPGGKVIVGAGTYAEDVLIDKSLTILGPNSDISPVTGTRVPEAVVKSFRTPYSEAMTGVTIKGFEVTGQVTSTGTLAGIYIGNTQNVAIEHNYIHDVESHGIAHFDTPIINLAILDNKLVNISTAGDTGIYVGYLTDATIADNLINTTKYAGINITAASTGVDILRNIISNTAGVGIQVSSGLGDVEVSGNIISNAGNGLNEADKGGIRVYGSGLTGLIDIRNNTITGSQNGIGIQETTLACDLSFIDVHDNSIATSNEVQAYNGCEDGSVLDATENWWGSADGPVGGQIVGDVAYCAWLNAAPPAGVPVAYPVINITTGEGFCTIQAAIDDADTDDEDIITVAAGTYAEAVDINKSLTLLGPNANLSPNTDVRLQEATFVATSDLPGDYPGLGAINLQGPDLVVTVKGFDFNLEGTSDPDYRYINVVNDARSTLHVENCIFRNAPETDNGYWWFTDAEGPHTVTILDNHFLNGGVSNGIQWGGNSFIVDIQDNVWEDNQGYAMNFNNATGTISGNQFIDRVDNGPEWYDDQLGMLFAGGGNDLDITGNTFDQVPEAAILMSYTFASKLDISGNTFMRSPGVVDTDWGYFIIQNSGDYSNVSIIKNSFLLDEFSHTWTNETPFDLTDNYWGSPCGPSNIVGAGPIDYAPWYADEDMTILREENVSGDVTFVPTMSTLEMNSIIACAEPYTTFTFTTAVDDVEYPGGIIVPAGQDHLTLKLTDGVKIIATSPCVTVNADYTTIMAENISMAACVTVAGSNGIDVADGIRNLTVDGLEIYGPGNDGIHFAGVIRDVVLVDNYIHNLAGNGVYFGAQPVVVDPDTNPDGIDIHGNLFKDNTLLGVTNPNGTAAIDATYNSWGDVAGPAAGDGVGPYVTATPYTHVDVYMVASGTPWTGIPLNQVVSGQPITFKVMAHVVNAEGVDVKLAYPTNLTGAVTSAATSAFPSFAEFDPAAPANTIWFHGMAPFVTDSYVPVTGDVELFTVTFTGGTPGLNLPMNLDELSDVFGMEGVGSSSNIYAVALLDSTVNVINLPVIDIVPVVAQPGPYTAGLPIEFNITVTNAGGGNFADLNLDFTLPTGAVLQYWDGDSWEAVVDPMTIGDLATGGTAFDPILPLFRVIFLTPPTGVISVALMDLAPATDFQLATTTETFTLLGNFTVTGTFSMQGRSTRAGIPVTLDYQDLVAYADKTGTTINQISYNLVIPEVNGGHWLLTTLQPRYLNVIIANNKIVSVDGNETLIALQLKGGNAVWTDNVINIPDASEVGTHYGEITGVNEFSLLNADVNFDGKVNIQDLALVGGNFDLTSEDAYGEGNLETWLVQ